MTALTTVFLKIFFRNRRAMFFVIFLPAALFLILALLRFEQVFRLNVGQNYTDFLLPGIVAFAVMQMGIYTVAYSLIDFHKQMVLKRLAVTPLTSGQFLLSQSLARFIIALIQTSLLLLLALTIFQTGFSWQIVFTPLIILVCTIIFLNFGSIIASIARDYEEAAPYTAVVGLSMSFLGDVFFPLANLPQWLQNFATALPMKPFVGLLRYSFFGMGKGQLLPNLLILLCWLVASTLGAKTIFAKKAYR